MDWTLELVVVPVSDVDRAKAFYEKQLGFHVDVDHSAGETFRVVQLTPKGSGASIALMRNDAPGTLPLLNLCVSDADAARDELVGRGVEASELFHFEEGQQAAGPDPARADYNTFFSFTDPDGNNWQVQEVRRGDAGS